jgi:Rhodopirellula transposase DDE domain
LKKAQSEQRNLSSEQIEDLKLAASLMSGVNRREFVAQITNKYCQGSARKAERLFGWKRTMVERGLGEQRTGIKCIGAQSANSGAKRWEEQQPEVAKILREMAEAHGQQDPTFKTTISYTRLTATQAIIELREQGCQPEKVPSPSTMAVILNRMGYRLRPVMKAKPEKKLRRQMRFLPTLNTKDALEHLELKDSA